MAPLNLPRLKMSGIQFSLTFEGIFYYSTKFAQIAKYQKDQQLRQVEFQCTPRYICTALQGQHKLQPAWQNLVKMWNPSDAHKIAIIRLATHSANQFGTSLSFQGAGFAYLFLQVLLPSVGSQQVPRWSASARTLLKLAPLIPVEIILTKSKPPQAGWRSSYCPSACPLLRPGTFPNGGTHRWDTGFCSLICLE